MLPVSTRVAGSKVVHIKSASELVILDKIQNAVLEITSLKPRSNVNLQ